MSLCGAIRGLRQGRSEERVLFRVAIAICTWGVRKKEKEREKRRETALNKTKTFYKKKNSVWQTEAIDGTRFFLKMCVYARDEEN